MHLQHHQAPEHSLCSSYFLGFLVLGFATIYSDGFLRELYDRSKSSPSGNLNKSAAQVSDDAPILSSWVLGPSEKVDLFSVVIGIVSR